MLFWIKYHIKLLPKACAWKIIIHDEYIVLKKLPLAGRSDYLKVKIFKEKLQHTMPFYHRNVIKNMEESKKGKTQVEIIAIDEDIAFMNSMMTDRSAQYSVTK